MKDTQRYLLIGIGIALLLGGAIYWFFIKNTATPSDDPGYVVEEINLDPPSLDRPYVISVEMPQKAKDILNADMVELTAMLREEPMRVDLWLELGVYYKIAGDFEGASDAWKYVSNVAPDEVRATAFGNLGDLYMNFIKDYPKAEGYYRQAVALKPDQISYYADMYRMYHYLYKTDTNADGEILEQGLKANPGNQDLLNLQTQMKSGK